MVRLLYCPPQCVLHSMHYARVSASVCVCLFLSVLISHTDAERGWWGTSSHTHTHTYLCSFGFFAVQRSGDHCNEVTAVYQSTSLLFLCSSYRSSSSSSSHDRRTFCLLTSVSIWPALQWQIFVLNSPQDTFHLNFLRWMSITLTVSDVKAKLTWTQNIRPLLFKFSDCFSDVSQHT